MEAYLHKHDTLPHLHGDLEKRFPKAVAQEEEKEAEDVTPCSFEQRGEKLGKEGCVVKADDKTTTTTTTTTTTKPASNSGHDHDHNYDSEGKAKKITGGEKKKVSFDLRRG